MTMRKHYREQGYELLDTGLEQLAKCELLRWKAKVARRLSAELERLRRSAFDIDRSFVEAYDHFAPEIERDEQFRRDARKKLTPDEMNELQDRHLSESTGMTLAEAADLRRQIEQHQNRGSRT
jgi:hypothetical protein